MFNFLKPSHKVTDPVHQLVFILTINYTECFDVILTDFNTSDLLKEFTQVSRSGDDKIITLKNNFDSFFFFCF